MPFGVDRFPNGFHKMAKTMQGNIPVTNAFRRGPLPERDMGRGQAVVLHRSPMPFGVDRFPNVAGRKTGLREFAVTNAFRRGPLPELDS